MSATSWKETLRDGQVIPALPLMLQDDGTWSRRHQRAIVRYYRDAGCGGIAVGVHSTQFAIRDPQHNLYEPILRLVAEELDSTPSPIVRIAGICGRSEQAIAEATLASTIGYHAGLLSLTAWAESDENEILNHCQRVADVIPIIGFYLQPSVGGRVLSFSFWRRFCDIPNVVAIKVAPFNRYQTLDVVRAVALSGRDDVALYTGNDDNIIIDLLSHYQFDRRRVQIVGGLLGQWGVWTRAAVELLKEIKVARRGETLHASWLTRNVALTDANAVIFDAANQFAGCIPGIMEVLRRQGLAPSCRCLNPDEKLSAGQAEELDRITAAYPDLQDDDFVRENLTRWLAE
ncbi:MAG TPA: dihydrodipicolinate synthase family protein [Planctomycetaceae bacterium]|nr:dihydrodipicolinate synthase family protein [Planctomycetaceae bacterium]